MTQGQILQQGRAAQGAFPGDKPISGFFTLPMPSWALAAFSSLSLPAGSSCHGSYPAEALFYLGQGPSERITVARS